MKRRVFIANRAYHNYEPAKKYGELVALTIGDVDIEHTDRLEAKIQSKLTDSQPNDLLMLGGAPILGAIAQGFLQRKHGHVNLLYWDPLAKDYTVRDNMDFAPRALHEEDASRPAVTAPDWTRKCSSCGATPIVPATGMCGPCTFGEASTAGGNW